MYTNCINYEKFKLIHAFNELKIILKMCFRRSLGEIRIFFFRMKIGVRIVMCILSELESSVDRSSEK